MRVTRSVRSGKRALLLALHGAGSGGAPGGLWAFRGAWDLPGLVIVAPSAAGTTWSLDRRDVGFVDRALQSAFRRCRVDRRRIAVGGFSAGAGLALWLGLSNGDLFRSVVALSGSALLPPQTIGRPRIVVAHGTRDHVIPVSQGGDEIARSLEAEGYDVVYRRFQGGHRVVPTIARASVLDALYR
jgi:phospholipase/carboxylesterase